MFHGRHNGVFLSWGQTEAQVKGYPRALFRGYRSEEEAQRVWAQHLKEIARENSPTVSLLVRLAEESVTAGRFLSEVFRAKLQAFDLPQ